MLIIVDSQIPICLYHGTPAERAELRRTRMRKIEDDPLLENGTSPAKQPTTHTAANAKPAAVLKKKLINKLLASRGEIGKGTPKGTNLTTRVEIMRKRSRHSSHLKTQLPLRRSARHRQEQVDANKEPWDSSAEADDELDDPETRVAINDHSTEDYVDEEQNKPDELVANVNRGDDLVENQEAEGKRAYPELPRQTKDTFPIVLTTYEMIIKDRQHLSKYDWNFIVVDEGHRLKNMDCKWVAVMFRSNGLMAIC